MEALLWKPSAEQLNNSQMARFRSRVERALSVSLPEYEDFFQASIQNLEVFWRLWLESSGMMYRGNTEPTLLQAPEFWRNRWFPQLRLNFAQNLLAHLCDTPLIALDEQGKRQAWSRAEVLAQVKMWQQRLEQQGVQAGDVVAGLLPNTPETILAMLAATSLGAIWSSCSPDFGVQGILDRLCQVQPKVLFVAESCTYNGKKIDLRQKNTEVARSLPTLQAVLSTSEKAPASSVSLGEITFIERGFSDPVYILFSSGTTGKPKCIVHGIGGTLLQHYKELALHCDLKSGEKILYYTTCGWMMWNWMVSALGLGATVYCYDGSPAYPQTAAIWSHVAREKIEVFGTSAKYIASCRSAGASPRSVEDLQHLRLVCSTGSPLLPEDFDYFYEEISSAESPIQLASISGGTDIVSCFVLGTPLKPVVRGEIQGRGLGMAVEAWNAAGKPVRDQQGELVCTQPFPSMPVSFWNDPQGERYKKAYFERFPAVWYHGDFITLKKNGGVVIHGRSDATLNPGGVRLGTAEIYRQVETLAEIRDSLVVGQKWEGDERVVLFVKLEPSQELTPELEKKIRARIREGASPRHVPAKILTVADIPYTVSGKKVELAVKRLIHGEQPENIEALSNPESLQYFQNRPELQTI